MKFCEIAGAQNVVTRRVSKARSNLDGSEMTRSCSDHGRIILESPANVNDASCDLPRGFWWQVQYLVMLEFHFWWQAHHLVMSECHFSWRVHYLVMLECHFSWQARHLIGDLGASLLVMLECHFSWQEQYLETFCEIGSAQCCIFQYKISLQSANRPPMYMTRHAIFLTNRSVAFGGRCNIW